MLNQGLESEGRDLLLGPTALSCPSGLPARAFPPQLRGELVPVPPAGCPTRGACQDALGEDWGDGGGAVPGEGAVC